MRLVTHGLEGYEFENTCNNDKNLSEIKFEHEKEDKLVEVVVKVVHDVDIRWEGDDFGVGVLHFHTFHTDILGFLEKFGWWFEQDISGDSEDDSENRPHPLSDCDDKPIGGPTEEEANYAFRGYRGNYYGRNFRNWRNRQSHYRDENQNSNPGEENPPFPRLPEKKQDEPEFEKTMREFVFGRISDHQSSRPMGTLPSNTKTNLKPSTSNDKPYRPSPTRNEHMNAVFIRSGKNYDPPVNPTAKPAIFLYNSEDKADEVKKDTEPLPKKPTHADPPPLKAYKPKITINVPLIDVLVGMPNYGKFLKDLVSNKSKMEQISTAFLTKECSRILQNKLPPKLRHPESFLIPCKLANSVEDLALADLCASINLMPYLLYAALSGTNLKPTRMSIRLPNHTYQ
uniref:Reverse transcriptase domain-containing protein n=1 Tax=Tanacetum cinerariifolium TaxID=118510 RepID=A0A6L2MEC6_TANCI|nr:hypothetical protein [Tanacetum cinerariifolium]